MPSLNITFSDDEMERVRQLAEQRGLALKPYVRDMALGDNREDMLNSAADRIASVSAELYRRLA